MSTHVLCESCAARVPLDAVTWDQGHGFCRICWKTGAHKRARYAPAQDAREDKERRKAG